MNTPIHIQYLINRGHGTVEYDWNKNIIKLSSTSMANRQMIPYYHTVQEYIFSCSDSAGMDGQSPYYC